MDKKQQLIFIDKFFIQVSAIYGLLPPQIKTPAYVVLRNEFLNLFFTTSGFNKLTEAEVVTAMRMNVDGQLDYEVQAYGAISRRFISGVLQIYCMMKARTMMKVDLQMPYPPPERVDISYEEILASLWGMFLKGNLHLEYIMPQVYDYTINNMPLAGDVVPIKPGMTDEEQTTAKQKWVIELFTDMRDAQIDFLHILKQQQP